MIAEKYLPWRPNERWADIFLVGTYIVITQADIDRATPRLDYSERHVLYTYYGLAAYWAQVLELEMLNLVAALHLTDYPAIDASNYPTAFQNLHRRTLGALLKMCRDKHPTYVTADEEDLLRNALQRRNYLIHRFFTIRDAELIDDPAPLVEELREIAAVLAAGSNIAQNTALSFFAAVDVPIEFFLRHGLAWENVIMDEVT